MKKNIILATAATALLLSVSCTKQDNTRTVSETKVFTVSIEQVQTTKTSLYNQKFLKWDDSDEILVNENAHCTIRPDKQNPSVASFELKAGDPEPKPPYLAVYPASLYYGDGKYQLPQNRFYEPDRFNAPMVAYSPNENLQFSNICGILKLSITDRGLHTLNRITISSASQQLWGLFEIDKNSKTLKFIPEAEEKEKIEGEVDKNNQEGTERPTDEPQKFDQYKIINFYCNEVKLSDTKSCDFFIYLPAGEYPMAHSGDGEWADSGDLCITFYDTSDASYSIYSVDDIVVKRNTIHSIEIDITAAAWSTVTPVDPGDNPTVNR